MRYILSERQINFLNQEPLNETRKDIEGCRVFSDKNEREFCSIVESEISSNLEEYQPLMESMLERYFSSDDSIEQITMDKLDKDSPMVVNGFNEINTVIELISKNCPRAETKGKTLKDKWLSKYNVYFKDENNNYHLLNRLDTNYTAMAVLITTYYKELIEQIRMWTNKKSTPSSNFVKNWINHFFNTDVILLDPRKGGENDRTGLWEKLKTLPNSLTIFDQVLKPESFKVGESTEQKNFYKALEQVRAKGFKTEDYFEEMLKKHGIVYKRYSGDYSFVDMILGIDFLIKQTRNSKDYWIPVQVKSSFREKSVLIDTFNCTIVIKPELITQKDGPDDFKIGDVRGFENYFCGSYDFCKVKKSGQGKKVYAPSTYDYLSSLEYEKG